MLRCPLTKVLIDRVHSEWPSGVSARRDHIRVTAYSNNIRSVSAACSFAVVGMYGAAFDSIQSTYMCYRQWDMCVNRWQWDQTKMGWRSKVTFHAAALIQCICVYCHLYIVLIRHL